MYIYIYICMYVCMHMFQPDVSACNHQVFLHGPSFLGALGTWSNHVPWRNGEFGWNTFWLMNPNQRGSSHPNQQDGLNKKNPWA